MVVVFEIGGLRTYFEAWVAGDEGCEQTVCRIGCFPVDHLIFFFFFVDVF